MMMKNVASQSNLALVDLAENVAEPLSGFFSTKQTKSICQNILFSILFFT